MAKIKHIALTTKDPSKVAEFYKEAFEMVEVRRSGFPLGRLHKSGHPEL